MFKEGFTEIFAELDSIEKQLKDNSSNEEKEEFSRRLLDLRKVMDQCIQSWLSFEERVNQMQDSYGLKLPDELPDMFFQGLGLEEPAGPAQGSPTGQAAKKEAADVPEGEPPSQEPFGGMRKDASISSFKRGLGFYDLYMLEEAIREFENLVRMEPGFIIGHFLLAHVYSHKGDHEEAEKEFRLVLALTEDPLLQGMVYNALGNIYAEGKKYEQALEEFHLARERSKEVKEASFNLAATQYNLGRYRESIEHFREALEHYPDDWEIHFYLGKAYQYLKDHEKSLPHLEEAWRLNPGDSLVNFELGVVYHLLNQREKAISQYIRTLELGKRKSRGQRVSRLN